MLIDSWREGGPNTTQAGGRLAEVGRCVAWGGEGGEAWGGGSWGRGGTDGRFCANAG